MKLGLEMSSVAIIPARSGSKRIPNKNIKLFHGKPIISYAIKNAINANIFDRVMVSTDNTIIADIAKQYGAEVPFYRSDINSSDHATTADTIIEVLQKYEQLNIKFNHFCCIYPCTPLLESIDIINSMKTLIDNNYATVFPVVKYSHPTQRCITIKNGIPNRLNKEYENTRTQDLEPMYYDAGQYYCGNVAQFLTNQQKCMLTNNTKCIVVEENKYQDIDNLSDWKLLEIKYEYNQRSI